MENKVNSLIKQNEAIYNSLRSKNVEDLGDLTIVNDDMTLEQKLEVLTQENILLKNLSNKNKPVQVPKVKAKPADKPADKPGDKPADIQDDDPTCWVSLSNVPPKYSKITDMYEIKKAFFGAENNDYTLFNELVKQHDFKLFNVNYKYSSDKDGAPDYVARNLIRGFIRNFDDVSGYFMICFRCILNNNDPDSNPKPTYNYPSLWIVNSNDPIEKIIGSLHDDFEFTEVIEKELKEEFYINFQKSNPESENIIGEGYVH